jgi:hypothetical protein
MRILTSDGYGVLKLMYCVVVAVLTSLVVDWLARAGNLIVGVVPLAIVLVIAFAWLDPKWQTGAWAGAGFWLLSLVYVVTGDFVEYIVFAVVVIVTILGVYKSPWFLVGLWFAHPLWDLMPRSLPPHLHDLPMACLIYDLIVAFYLVWAIRTKRIIAWGATAKSPT